MGNPNRAQQTGRCTSCNANAGPWNDEPNTVRCLRPLDSCRHVMRGDAATIHAHSCWASVTEPLKLDAVADLLHQIQVKSKARS